MAEEDDTLVGKLVDRRYRVVAKLGGGGMGTVYEVEHSLLRASRALKLIKHELAQEPGYRQRFFNEARWLNEARHPHIVAVHDFQEDPDHGLFLVMELIRGVNLKTLIQAQGRLRFSEVLRIGREVATALEHVHGLGRVHRDVKPANILVEEDTGRAVVTDFGIAKDLSGTGDETLTGTLEVVGTLNYASPEQLGGDRDMIDQRTDIFALGAVLFEMYAGKHYGGIGQVSRLKYPEPPPEEFRAAVRACLELDVDRRLGSAAQLIQLLQQCEEALRLRERQSGETGLRDLAAAVSEQRAEILKDPSAILAGDAETRATVVGTQVGGAMPPPAPKDGTATIQQRQAAEVREQVLQAQIEEQHRHIDDLRLACLDLRQYLSSFGLSATGFKALETLPERMAEVTEESDLERRRARLEGLEDELLQARQGIESALFQAVETAGDDLLSRVDRMRRLGAPLVDADEVESLGAAAETARQRFAARDFAGGRTELEEVERRVQAAWAQAMADAGGFVADQFGAIGSTAKQIAAISPPGAEPLDVAAVKQRVDALLQDGDVGAACDLARQAVAESNEALARAREERAAELRRDLEALVSRAGRSPSAVVGIAADAGEEALTGTWAGITEEIDGLGRASETLRHALAEVPLYEEASEERSRAEAMRQRAAAIGVAAGDLEPALASLQAGDDSLRQRQWSAAAAAFTRAAAEVEGAENAYQIAAEDKAQRRAAAETALRDEMARAAGASDELAADVVAAARETLEGERPVDFGAEIGALTRALAALRATLDEQPAYDRMADRAGEAEQARVALEALGLGAEEAAVVERIRSEADDARRRRAWSSAAEAYARVEEQRRRIEDDRRRAEEERARLEEERRRHALEQRLSASREAAESARGAVDERDGEELGSDLAGEAGSLLQRARQADEGRDLERAADLYDATSAAYAQLRRVVEEAWRERLGHAEGDLAAAVELSQEEPEALVGLERAAADRLLRDDTQAPRARLEALSAAQASLERELARRGEYDQLVDARRAAEAALATAVAAGVADEDLAAGRETLTRAVDASGRRLWNDARDACRDTVLAVERAKAALQLRQEQRAAAEARAAAERARAGVDLDWAAEVAAGPLAETAALEEKAAAFEARGEFVAAAAAWADLSPAFDRVAQAVEADKASVRAEAEQQVRARLESTAALPEELAGRARRGAGEILAAARPGRFREEKAALAGAAAALDAVAGQEPAYRQAVEVREQAQAARERVFARKPKRARRREIESLLAAAAKAESAEDWPAVREAYASALQASEALERTLVEQPTRAPIGKIAAALGALGAAAVGVYVVVQTWSPQTTDTAQKPPPAARPEAPKRSQGELPKDAVADKPAPRPDDVAAAKPVAPAAQPAPVAITAFAPSAEQPVPIAEGSVKRFDVDVSGGAPGSPPIVRWLLDGQEIARGSEWTYKPGFADAGDHTVVAAIENGPEQPWKVSVSDVNRPPVIGAQPKSGAKVEAKVGDKVTFAAPAKDEDGDALTYRWTVDGKAAGADKPTLDVQVASAHEVGVTVGDAKDEATANWRVSLAALPPFELKPQPAKVDRLRFGAAQELSLVAPSGKSLAGVQVAWAVDGKKIADGPKFSFAADEPDYVRSAPVRVTATATDQEGQTFSKEWKIPVQPPPPQIEKPVPSATEVEGEPGSALEFAVGEPAAVGDQRFTYTFAVNGSEAQKGAKPSFTLTPKEGQGEIAVTARIEDNYKQAPATRAWKVKLASVASVADDAVPRLWVNQLESAFKAQDAERVAELRRLDANKAATLRRAFDVQKEYRVDFSGTTIQRLDGKRSRVTYEMDQSWVATSGQQGKGRSRCTDVLTIEDGRVDAVETSCTKLE